MSAIVNKKYSRGIRGLIRIGLSALALIAVAHSVNAEARDSRTKVVNCDNNNERRTINRVIKRAKEGDRIVIVGTCTENVVLNKGVILDGGGTGAIIPADTSLPTISVIARDASIIGLTLDSKTDEAQIAVTNLSLVTIENNQIGNSNAQGIEISGSSFAIIIGNHIFGNISGVVLAESSNARVGLREISESSILIPNIISDNTIGIIVARSSANIVGNQIVGNLGVGVFVAQNSSIRVAGNEISGSSIGIFNRENSTTDLALNGSGKLSQFNTGVNTNASISCISGYVGGGVGPDFANTNVVAPCENQLIP